MSNARFSIIQSRAVGDSRISNAQFRTLAALGKYGDRNGWCFPKLKTLGDTLGKSPQAVSKDLQALVEFGYVQKIAQFREDGGQSHNRYRLIFDFQDEETDPPQRHVEAPSTPEVEALTPHINAPTNAEKQKDFFDEKPELYFQMLDEQNKTAQPHNGTLTSEEYKERVRNALSRGLEQIANQDVGLDLSSWPEDVREVIAKVCELWNIKPPTNSKRKGSPSATWIVSARDLLDSCAEFGVDAIESYYSEWVNASQLGAAHSVNGPRSLVNVVRGHVAKLRDKEEEGIEWKGMSSIEYSDGAKQWQNT